MAYNPPYNYQYINQNSEISIPTNLTGTNGIYVSGTAGPRFTGATSGVSGKVDIDSGYVAVNATGNATVLGTPTTWTIAASGTAYIIPQTNGATVTVNGTFTGPGTVAMQGDVGGVNATTQLSGSVAGVGTVNSYGSTNVTLLDLPSAGTVRLWTFTSKVPTLTVNYSSVTYPTPPNIATKLQFDSGDNFPHTPTFSSSGTQTFVSSLGLARADAQAATHTLTLSGSTGGTFNGNGTNAGSGVTNFVKSGASTYTLGGNNASVLNGTITLSGGTLKATNSNAVGTAASSITMSGASTVLALAGNIAIPRAVSAIGTIRNDSDSNSLTSTVTLIGNTIFDVTGSLALTSGNAITGGFGITKNGSGSLLLSATASTFSGAVTLNGGTTQAPTLAPSGSNSAIGAGSSVAFAGDALLLYTGSASVTFNRSLTFNSATAAGFQNSGTGTLVLNGAVSATSSTIALAGSNTGFNRFETAILSGANGFAKSGAGRWVVAGANDITGSSPITGGTLVAANAATNKKLVGSPVISGGAKLQVAKESDNKGRCTYGSLSMGLGATAGNKARLRIGGIATSPTVLMSSNLNLPTAGPNMTWDLTGDTFKIPGTYTLVEFSGAAVATGGSGGNVLAFVTPVVPTGRTYSNFQYNSGASPKTITIQIS